MTGGVPAAAVVAGLRLLLVSMEFAEHTVFSGNGVLARSIAIPAARAVAAAHDQHAACGGVATGTEACEKRDARAVVDVLCAVPGTDDVAFREFTSSDGSVREVRVSVPDAKWRRLDRQSAWREFADGAALAVRAGALRAPAEYDAVLFVDWTAAVALRSAFSASTLREWRAAGRLSFLNFRTFTSSAGPRPEAPALSGAIDKRAAVLMVDAGAAVSDWEFYATFEAWAATSASHGEALSPADVRLLQEQAAYLLDGDAAAASDAGAPSWQVLLPPLRADVADLAGARRSDEATAQAPSIQAALARAAPSAVERIAAVDWSVTRLVACVVRLDPAKEAHRFVDVVRALLAQPDVPPLALFVAGARGDAEYASGVLEALNATGVPLFIAEGFLDARAMGDVYAHVALNVHPCRYDAYGMTVVEAAAFGVPSLVHFGGTGDASRSDVGCTALLKAAEAHVVPVDLEAMAAGDQPQQSGGNGVQGASDIVQGLNNSAASRFFSPAAAEARVAAALGYTEAHLTERILDRVARHARRAAVLGSTE